MEIQYTLDNEIQGIILSPAAENYKQQIADLSEIINDTIYYNAYVSGNDLLIGKKNNFDQDIVKIKHIDLVCISIDDTHIMFQMMNYCVSLAWSKPQIMLF